VQPDAACDPAAPRRGSHGRLRLVAGSRSGRTRLVDVEARPPLQTLRAHYLDLAQPDMAFVMIATTGGGVLQGDRLELSLRLEPGARLHLQNTSATRIYRAPERSQEVMTELTVGPGAFLEYVPDPYIPYAGSEFAQVTRAQVGAGGVLILGEVVGGGRAAHGEQLAYRRFSTRIDVSGPGGAMLFRDAMELIPSQEPATPGALGGGGSAVGTLHVVAVGFGASELLPSLGRGLRAGAGDLPNGAGAWVRVISSDVEEALATVRAAWDMARTALLGAPVPPSRRY
jgi:urease accessory protein